MSIFARIVDGVFGRGEHAITVPPMDGALRPNTRLDSAEILREAPGCDSLAVVDGALVFSAGNAVLAVQSGKLLAEFDDEVTFIAPLPGGGAVVGCAGGALFRFGGTHGGSPEQVAQMTCPTAAVALDDMSLVVTCGSSIHGPGDWRRDLLEKRRAGRVLRLGLASGETLTLAEGLGWPAGVALTKGGEALLISEAWAARLIRVPLTGGAPTEVLGNLPGYPGHISHGAHGQWVAIFAPRSQLVEFVLSEPKFRRTMMAEIDPALWIAPTLRSGRHFHEPVQAGGVRQLGVIKPWAPMRSFGLVLHLGEDLNPIDSFHSRADGARHGVTSVIEAGGKMIFAAKGDGVIGARDLEDKA